MRTSKVSGIMFPDNSFVTHVPSLYWDWVVNNSGKHKPRPGVPGGASPYEAMRHCAEHMRDRRFEVQLIAKLLDPANVRSSQDALLETDDNGFEMLSVTGFGHTVKLVINHQDGTPATHRVQLLCGTNTTPIFELRVHSDIEHLRQLLAEVTGRTRDRVRR
jgi:hypothetical protein